MLRSEKNLECRKKIDELVRRLQRLAPDHRNPHRVHEEKSEIAYEMTRIGYEITQLARRMA